MQSSQEVVPKLQLHRLASVSSFAAAPTVTSPTVVTKTTSFTTSRSASTVIAPSTTRVLQSTSSPSRVYRTSQPAPRILPSDNIAVTLANAFAGGIGEASKAVASAWFGYPASTSAPAAITRSAVSPVQQRRELHPFPSILAFGDSLTAGWMHQASPTAPYSEFLLEMMGLPQSAVVLAGKAGQRASAMRPRLQAELARGCCFDGKTAETCATIAAALRKRVQESGGKPFDVVVLLAGSNDLRLGERPEVVLQELLGLHSLIRDSGSRCVAVTVPQCGPTDSVGSSLTGPRRVVNDGLRAAAAASLQGRGPPLWLADIDSELARLPRMQRDALFTDDVHFTREGYKFIASVISKAVSQIAGNKQSAARHSLAASSFVQQVPRPLVPAVAVAAKKRPRVAYETAASIGRVGISFTGQALANRLRVAIRCSGGQR
eukprot:TRINITY_DN74958_c0_g1_i1.p1 TRINITY_DN74958_c0_g1~~TRINITY_DN74958_c0_g1_i1.p1  ORF type:complete len:433 (-),score=76.11 TRINITY_DN74958_c0_g1_i1:55-1353(-)